MTKYRNICVFLDPFFIIDTTLEIWNKTNQIHFKCKAYHHENSLTSASFSNKKSIVPIEEFCVQCKKDKDNKIQLRDYIETIRLKTGHVILSVDFSSRHVEYQCGNCDSITHSQTHNLLNVNKGTCSKCQNDKFRLTNEEINIIVENHQMKLILDQPEYTNNKKLLSLICRCGRPHKAVLSDIRAGKHCQECKKEKYKETCMTIYGVENAFQSEEIKQKSKETCMKKYGFEHAMRHPDIIRKSLQTAYHKIQYELPSGEIVSLMGYEPIALEELYQEGFTEDEIKLVNVPIFYYQDESGKEHTYLPDMYIPHLHQIIEVKSPFTESIKKDNNRLKFDKVIADGYSLRVMVYDRGGKRKVRDELF